MTDNKNEVKDIEFDTLEMPIVQQSDQNYGKNSETLDAGIAIRNISTGTTISYSPLLYQ